MDGECSCLRFPLSPSLVIRCANRPVAVDPFPSLARSLARPDLRPSASSVPEQREQRTRQPLPHDRAD